MAYEILFDPIIPQILLIALGVGTLIVLLLQAITGSIGALWRAVAMGLLLLILANPSVQQEERTPVNDVVAIVVDRSASQNLGERNKVTDDALAELQSRLARLGNLDIRTIESDALALEEEDRPLDSQKPEGTRLFSALKSGLGDVPRDRLSAAILLTDGQVHDVPGSLAELGIDRPVHGLITGRKDEIDRKLTVEKAPRFGIVGDRMSLDFRIDDFGVGRNATGAGLVKLTVDGTVLTTQALTTGVTHTLTYPLEHGGTNVVEIEVSPIDDEITVLNNRAVILTNGVRDRLRVLLVSGEPHAGERTWRNLLKADPSVDLVHFTILRPPEKQDGTPISELSLIAFPTRELFSQKLDDFDLIVFDRYQQRGVLPIIYLGNIAKYVEDGGAVLTAAGPAFASTTSLYRTPLAAVLPSKPTGRVIEKPYRPLVTDIGAKHPVTADLPGANQKIGDDEIEASWGRWFRFIESEPVGGSVVMDGPDGGPLLLLDRVGKGRVAQMLSDHAWLWTRGYDNGGPQGELLRRLAHWLMKEPDLEEERLTARVDGDLLVVNRRTLAEEVPDVTIETPDGKEQTLALVQVKPGVWQEKIKVSELGLYRLNDGLLRTVAAVGPVNPLEFADVRATDELIKPIADETGGGTFWIGKQNASFALPSVREAKEGRSTAGRNWLGIARNNQYTVESTSRLSLASPLLFLVITLIAMVFAWRSEAD